jgi:hypothetical protein
MDSVNRGTTIRICLAFTVVCFFVALYQGLRTWNLEWETYSNGPLPSLTHAFNPFYFTNAWGLWVFLLATSLNVIMMLRARLRLAGIALLLTLVGVPFIARVIKNQQLYLRTVSCANHSGQWHWEFSHLLEERMGTNGLSTITNTVEFDDLLGTLEWLPKTTHSRPGERFNLYCPGRKSSGSITGYAFVGGGLSLDEAKNADALLIFCEAECHPPPHDHQHAVMAATGRHCLDLQTMIEHLETALKQADEGKLNYSDKAVRILREELAKRRSMIRR